VNQLKAKVIHIKNVDTLHYLTFSLNQQVIHMLSLELDSKLKVGTFVHLAVKATHVSIAKELNYLLSLDNRLEGTIISIENGEILSSICLDIEGFHVESIISMESKTNMNLKVDDKVIVLINSADISIVNENKHV
jgi:molybdopterin-binding protein